MPRIILVVVFWISFFAPAFSDEFVCPTKREPAYEQSLEDFNKTESNSIERLSYDLNQAIHCAIFLHQEFFVRRKYRIQEIVTTFEKVINLTQEELGKQDEYILKLNKMLEMARSFTDQNWVREACQQKENLFVKTLACTAAIKSGHWQRRDLAWAFSNLGHAHLNAEEYDQAIAAYDEAIRFDHEDFLAYVGRGTSYTELGDYQKTIYDYDQAIRLDPSDSYAYRERGYAHYKIGEYSKSITNYNKALRLQPDDLAAYNNRAWALYLLGRNEEALSDTEKALSLNPASADSIDTKAHVLAAFGRREEALEEFERAMLFGSVEQVRLYQKALQSHGYDPGRADGIRRTETTEALTACIMAGCRLLE